MLDGWPLLVPLVPLQPPVECEDTLVRTAQLEVTWDLCCPQGPLGVAVTYGGDHIPKSPFSVAVAPTLDLSKISVAGLGDSAYTSREALFPTEFRLGFG